MSRVVFSLLPVHFPSFSDIIQTENGREWPFRWVSIVLCEGIANQLILAEESPSRSIRKCPETPNERPFPVLFRDGCATTSRTSNDMRPYVGE